jgi:hypothetical protein
LITINGVALSALGFRYHRRRLPRLMSQRVEIAEVPGADPLLLGLTTPAARLHVEGRLAAATHAELLTAVDAISAALRGSCVVRFADITDREWSGVLDPSSDTTALDPAEIARKERVQLMFACAPPYARAQTVTEVVGANPALVLGNAYSLLDVDVQNGAGAAITQITVAVRDGTTVLRTLTWIGSIASGDLWELKMDPAWEITNDDANAIDGLTSTSEWPIADPADGADNLLVSVTGGASPVVTTRYRRRW